MDPNSILPGLIGGLLIGLYSLFQLRLTGQALGCSTGYGNFFAFFSSAPYFHEGPYANPMNWRLWFTLGLPVGGLLAITIHGPGFQPTFDLGAMYESVMPQAVWAKAAVLFVAGTCIGFGARLAGGCTSGHSIVGVALMAPSSLLASVGFFLGGTIAVQTLFRLSLAASGGGQ